jgi:pimeloyl-ACP methyl ester carboxylesterase
MSVTPTWGRRVVTAFATAAIALTVVAGSVTPASAAAVADPCAAKAVFVGVRGTGAPAGTAATRSGNAWTSGGHGLVASLAQNYAKQGTFRVYVESLAYPASSDYFASVAAGVKKLKAEIGYINTTCKGRTKIVLAGHSQGADVVLDTLASLPAGRLKNLVVSASVFGDPTYVAGQKYNAAGSGRANGLLPRSAKERAVLNSYTFRNDSGAAQSRIRSFCFAGDFACQAAPSNARSHAIHNSYRATDAAGWSYAVLRRS